MKKKWKIILPATAAVLVLALIAGLIWLHYLKNRPGAHVVGGRLYADFSGVGYVIDAETGKMTEDQTPVLIKGKENKAGNFEGTLEMLGFPITQECTIKGDAVVEELGDGFYRIYYAPTCTHVVEDITGRRQETHCTTYEYTYFVNVNDPDFMVAYVYAWAQLDGDPKFVVYADSEEQAMQDYQWFLENDPEN